MVRTGTFFRFCFRKIPAEAAAFILMCILMAVPFLLAQKNQEYTPQKNNDASYTVMVSDAGLTEEERRALDYWETAGSPSVFTKTDFKGPVSGPVHKKFLAGLRVPVHTQHLSETEKELPAFPLDQRSVRELDISVRIPVKDPESLPEESVQTEAPAGFITDDSGREISGLVCPLPEKIPSGLKPTVLRVRPSASSGLPPSVQITESSGNSAMDVLALRSAGKYAVRTAFSGTMVFDWQNAQQEKKQ